MFFIGDKGPYYVDRMLTWDDRGVKIFTKENSDIRWKCGIVAFNPSQHVKMVSFVKLCS